MKPMIKLSLLLAFALAPSALDPADAHAQGKTTTPALSKSQCDKLCDFWWQAEDQVQNIRTCRTVRCNQIRYDLLHYQTQIADVWNKGRCDQHYGTRPF